MLRVSVPDMSCGHCQASIEAALAPLAATLAVDLAQREVQVSGAEAAVILQALAEIGFEGRVLASGLDV